MTGKATSSEGELPVDGDSGHNGGHGGGTATEGHVSHETARATHETGHDPMPAESDAVSLRPDVQARLGDKLKEVYADVLNAPVPDRFTELLAQLGASGGHDKSDGQ